ncbi:MAG: CPBP family intramembrane metalloprotease [candidate division WS1 bacterium]|nr:CPBP family intramembrane metalloprotease [candidate division WS1 bacterium]
MSTPNRPRLSQATLWRIALVASIFAIGVAVYRSQDVGAKHAGGQMPHPAQQEMMRRQLIQPDLLMRMSLFGRQVQERMHVGLPQHLDPDSLYDRAMAQYETLVLDPGIENPYADCRLGVFYGLRGYPDQAQALFLEAAVQDVENEALYLALIRLFSPHRDSDESLDDVLPHLQSLPIWLAHLTVPRYYVRLTQETDDRTQRSSAGRTRTQLANPLQEARHRAAAHQWRFGWWALLLGSIVMLLLLLSASVLVVFLWQGIFSVPRRADLSRARVPWHVPWRLMDIAEVLAVLLLALLAAGLALGAVAEHLERITDSPTVRAIMVAVQYLLVMLIAVRLMMWRIRATRAQKLSVLGLRTTNRVGSLLLDGVAGYSIYLLVLLMQGLMNQSLPVASPVMQLGMDLLERQDPLSVVLYLALLGLAAPLVEELIFRGFVYAGLRRYLPPFTAVIISAGVFALMHLNPMALVQLVVMGIILAVLYERSRSLIPCIVCHAVNNILAFAVILLVSY